MGLVPRQEDLPAMLADVLRRLGNLETSARLTNASMRGGSFRVLDDDGVERARLGLLDDGSYGVEVFNADGDRVFGVTDVGLVRPAQVLAAWDSRVLTTARSTTSATFTTMFKTDMPTILADGLKTYINVGTDVGTTGELRVRLTGWNGGAVVDVDSAVRSIASGYGGGGGGVGPTTLAWEHGFPIAQASAVNLLSVQWQVRRTGGAGNVYASLPQLLFVGDADELGATGGGGTWT